MKARDARTQEIDSQTMVGKPLAKARIVIADDNEQILNLVTELLHREFNIVAAVRNGEEAFEAVTRLAPEVLVTDIEMPILDGFQVANQLRSIRSSVKVVFLSGLDDPEYVEQARIVNASGFVSKAYVISDLRRAILDALAGRFFMRFEREI